VVLGAIALVVVLIGGAGEAVARMLFGAGGSQPSKAAIADIPSPYLNRYIQAAKTCPGLDWSILAAIGKIESDHGRSTLPGVHSGSNDAGAGGPMQFLQPTFDSVTARHPIPPGGTTPPSRYHPHDAIHAAAAYLCDHGARDGQDLPAAIYAYNHADWYVAQVLTQAEQYRSTTGIGTDTAPSTAALQAINYAQGQLGLPYVWGGDGPAHGDPGFDCSGLTHAAYAAAGITLPRTAHAQYHAGPHVPAGAPLAAGDLVFYGNPTSRITHVGLYVGSGQMIHAPTFGQPIQIAPYRWTGDTYAGATRPVNQPSMP
jgi:cell wall-associated NlpC family hydrolase